MVGLGRVCVYGVGFCRLSASLHCFSRHQQPKAGILPHTEAASLMGKTYMYLQAYSVHSVRTTQEPLKGLS